MATRARILAFAVMLFLFLGLATSQSRASRYSCVKYVSLLSIAQPGGQSPGKDAVSAQKTKEERQRPTPEESKQAAAANGPMAVFTEIEKAWNKKNVDGILRHFGGGKVTISIGGTGPSGGQFSKNQSYYLLKDLFKYTITRKFEFVQYRKPNREGKSSFAVAERHYQKRDDGRLFKDKIYVSLHLESVPSGDPARNRWVIDEIKSIR